MGHNRIQSEKLAPLAFFSLLVLGLYLSRLHSYLLFHNLVEIITISIGFTLFVLTWNIRRYLVKDAYSILGTGYAFIALIDLLHALAYKGMSVFPGYGANLPTQLWIAARLLQASTLCCAPLFLTRRIAPWALVSIYAAIDGILILFIYSGHFPDCYLEGSGLTPFKVNSEYAIILLLLAALFLFWQRRNLFSNQVFHPLLASIGCTILSELLFTAYLNVYDLANLGGHFFKLAAFYLIYRSIFVIGIKNPFELIFRDLQQTQTELTEVKNTLQEQVDKRTGELLRTNEQLKSEINQREKMEAQTLLLSKIVQFSNDAIIGKDPEGIILAWNQGAEQTFGYRAEEMVGKTVGLLLPPDRQHELTELLAQVKRGEKLEGLVTEWLHKDGHRLFVSLTISTISDGSGQIVGISTIARDITRKLQAEEEVRRLNAELEQRVEARTLDLAAKRSELENSRRALMNLVEDLHMKTSELEQANIRLQEIDHLKSMFIASMSHELRTPLNSIIGFSSILLHQWIGPVSPEQQENLAIILRCGKHLLSLINDVIDVAKIEAGKIDPCPETFELGALIEEAVELIKPKVEEKGLELQVQSVNLSLYTDRRRLLQCLLNLLSNAIKYTEQGRVELIAKAIAEATVGGKGEMVEISVADTGIGIKQEDFSRMFQPFVRLEHARLSAIPGTGLGLYLSQKLATEVLKGNITLISEYGRGSRFTLRVATRLP